MSADATEVAAAPRPPMLDPQDPLPESNWKWRRIFIFAASVLEAIALGFVLWMLYRLATLTLGDDHQDNQTVRNSIEALYNLGFWLIILCLADRVLYLIAPSAEQATKMLATVSAWKANISTTSIARSSGPDGTVAEASTAAGPAAGPAAAPAAPAAPVPPAGATQLLPEYAR